VWWKNCEKRLLASLCMSVRLSVSPHGITWLLLDALSWNFIFSIFPNSVEKIQLSLKSDENNGTLHEDQYTFFILSLSLSLKMINVPNKACRENQNTHFIFNYFFNRAVMIECWDTLHSRIGHRGQYCACTLRTGQRSVKTRNQIM
jgi:hypothetical protein